MLDSKLLFDIPKIKAIYYSSKLLRLDDILSYDSIVDFVINNPSISAERVYSMFSAVLNGYVYVDIDVADKETFIHLRSAHDVSNKRV